VLFAIAATPFDNTRFDCAFFSQHETARISLVADDDGYFCIRDLAGDDSIAQRKQV
jgi:hypothetical protein